jgi:hypothetical protein
MLLPRKFNDGTAVPDNLFADTLLELEEQFGAVSSETQTIKGRWRHGEQTYTDEHVKVFLDVPDSPENLNFFREYKEILKTRFQQIEIWMTTYPLDVI